MKDLSIKKVLLLGSGALKIGQAGEFDYSGSQALKALREEGIETVLINPNIATVQTSEGVADKIYFLPITPYFVEKVIEQERPQGILLSFGGQTALNCGVELYTSGVLEKYGVKVLGTPVQAIMDTEDRDLFVRKLDEIGVATIKSHPADNYSEALEAAHSLGYPLIVRAAYALGGLGSGFVEDDAQLEAVCEKAFSFSPQVLVEKSLKGWKEIEYEVVRDKYDNCVTVCNMENFDPLGIHTGESIVVAPSQTLSNKDYHFLRELSIKIVRHIGIIGECNVQYAYNPDAMEYRVIEVNARLSRSSALASKATGYPLAFVAAKLGLGYGLFDLKNSVTKTTPAFFEPALDYVVCKIPRWDLTKFRGVSRKIGSSMKSVGEVMAIGRSFEEAIQKGLRMIGQGAHGFVANKELSVPDIDAALREPDDNRIFVISKAMLEGRTVEEIHALTKIDRWFLDKLARIVATYKRMQECSSLEEMPAELLLRAKRQGFSDFQIQRAVFKDAEGIGSAQGQDMVRAYRKSLGIVPHVKQIDTLAAEFPARTNYLYLTYNGTGDDIKYENDGKSVIVLGSGAYRIGSSVEFDWCSVNCLETVRKQGYRGVLINYNPETVSTDYDMCDRLYFDELSFERVLDICELESPHGVVVSVGGQIPNNLAMRLASKKVPILGTQAEDIDKAEDRDKFSSIVDALGVDQPVWSELTSIEDVDKFIARVGFPVLVRPSYVLSGAAMNVCYDEEKLKHFLTLASEVSPDHPVVISKFMTSCKEIEFDAVADGGEVIAYAISEHIEYAGVHSGDATIQFPPQKLYVETVRRIKKIARLIAGALKISGPFNIQFLAKDNQIKVIECNLRASRSFPFVSKVLKLNLIDLATKVMLGLHPEAPHKSAFDLDYVGVKSSQFSFARLENADPKLGVDMSSTGEVGCIGDDLNEALLKSVLAVGNEIPAKRILMSTGDPVQKAEMLGACRLLSEKGYEIYATAGTYRYLVENGIPATRVLWPDEVSGVGLASGVAEGHDAGVASGVAEGHDAGVASGVASGVAEGLADGPKLGSTAGCRSALEMIQKREVDMVINIPKNHSTEEFTNGYQVRRAAIDYNIPLFTNERLAVAFIRSFCSMSINDIQIKSWDKY